MRIHALEFAGLLVAALIGGMCVTLAWANPRLDSCAESMRRLMDEAERAVAVVEIVHQEQHRDLRTLPEWEAQP